MSAASVVALIRAIAPGCLTLRRGMAGVATMGQVALAQALSDSKGWIDVTRLKGPTNFVVPAICSPDGQRIASRSADGTCRHWDDTVAMEVRLTYPRQV